MVDDMTPETEAKKVPVFVEADTLESGAKEPDERLFIEYRTNVATNALSNVDSRKKGFQPYTTNRYDTGKYSVQNGQLQIIFDALDIGDGIDKIRISARTDRTFTALRSLIPYEKYYSDEGVTVETTLDHIMKLFGLRERRSARDSIAEDLYILGRLAFVYYDGKDYIDIPLRGDVSRIKNGRIEFTFSRSYIQSVRLGNPNAFNSLLDSNIFKINLNDNPHSWAISKKLHDHYHQQITNENTRCRLSVERLLTYVTTIPTKAEVEKTGGRGYRARIIEPFERDLNHLVDIGILADWDYCHSKGEPLSKAEQDACLDKDGNRAMTLDYSTFVSLYINWDWGKNHNVGNRIANKERSNQQKRELAAGYEMKQAKRIERREKAADKKIGEAKADKKLAGDGI